MSGPRPEQDWFEKAEKDLEMARRAMLPGNPIPLKWPVITPSSVPKST